MGLQPDHPGREFAPSEHASDYSPYVVGDLAVSERFLAQHSADVKYCPAVGFYAWDGARWRYDDRRRV